jgi:electron transfer flavoprotein alpha subunit
MKIVCLVKHIPRPDAIEFDQETKSLKREGVPLIVNPFDVLAVTEAVRLRRPGDVVIAMAMGPARAEEALRECLGLGADRCIQLSDRAFALADTIGTSRTLALGLEKEGYDLVLCGRKTLDAETWQVPPEVAAFLGCPHATGSVGLELLGERLHVRRETDDGEQMIELPLPAVVSVARAEHEPSGEPEPRDGRIDVWGATDLVDDLQEEDKRFGQTGSPTRVLAIHDVAPERAGERVGSVEEAASRIHALAAERPAGTTAWDKPPHLAKEPGRFYDCWTLVEIIDGRASRASLELLAKGRELSGKLGGANVALVLGQAVDGAVDGVSRHGAEIVYVAEDAVLDDYVPEPWVAAVRTIVERERPHVLLIPATLHGRDLGPRLAGELQFGMTADCVDLGIDRGGRLVQHKPAYGGNIVSVIMGSTTPQLATVRPRMFEPLEPRASDAEVRRVELPSLPHGPTRLVERTHTDPPPWRLDEAEIVVGVGPSIDVSALEDAAGRADAAIGGDRNACATGVVPWNAEIGIKGRAVAPRIYVAIEADPGFEHLTGTVKAGVIAAIAGDERSPLLDAADIGLTGDWREVAPALLNALA